MDKTTFPIEVALVATTMTTEYGKAYVALIKEEEGTYRLPADWLGKDESSADAVLRILKEQVSDKEKVDWAISMPEAYSDVNRVAGDRVVAIKHTVQLIDDLLDTLDGCVMFEALSTEHKVLLQTDTETIALYRDGRVTGDATLVDDYASMITAIM